MSRTKLLDTFAGTGPTALASHTPQVGGPWIDVVGGWTVQDDVLFADGDTVQSRILVEIVNGFIIFAVDLNGCDPAYVITIQLNDGANHVMLFVSISGSGIVNVYELNSSGGAAWLMILGAAPLLLPLSGVHQLVFRLTSTKIFLTVDGISWFETRRGNLPGPSYQIFLLGGALGGDPSPKVSLMQIASS